MPIKRPMKRTTHRFLAPFLAVAAFAGLIAGPSAAGARDLPSPKEPWIELRTADFTIYSNAGERKAREIGEDLERLHDALAQLSPGLVLSSPVPTSIFVFKDAFSFQPYVRSYNSKVVDKGGYFLGRQLGNYVAINADQHGQERELIYHEYIHYLLRNNVATLPLWLHEGLAEYYSTLEVNQGEARLGLAPAQHVQWLRQHSLIPLATIFAVDEHSPEYNEWSRTGGFYAESWLLVHYLISGNPARRREAAELLRLAQAGTPAERLFAAAFGADPAALEAELRPYVQKYSFYTARLPLRPEANLAMTARPMPWPETLSRLGDLLGHLSDDHLALAAEHFRAALAAQPAPADQASALAGLGQLAERAGKAAEARAFYEQAAPLAPADPTVQYLLARSLLADPAADSLRRARAALQKVVATSPDFGEAWASLGYTWQAEEDLGPEAVTSLEAAHRLLPARMDVAHNLALAYARTGQGQKAGEVIERVLVPGGASAEEIASARDALLDEEQRRAEELIEADRTAEAVTLLERLSARTTSPARRDAIAGRLEEIRRRQSFNRFVESYNQAVELANQGDVKGAAAILEPLLTTTLDPMQTERARALLERLRPPAKKGGKKSVVPH
jgi:tetratricopeptide (TPR) repeat protein